MAQKFMSPGVFTTEIDLSFLAQGVAGIGAVVVGRTPKGPAFAPTFVNGLDAFAAVFGDPDPDFQLPYAAKNYLKNSNALTVVRVLGHDDGSSVGNGMVLSNISAINDVSGSGKALAVIHHTSSLAALTVTGVPLDANNFIVKLTGSTPSTVLFAATASFVKSSPNYIGKVLNTDPTKFSTYGHYLYQVFPYAAPAASASWSSVGISGSTTSFQRNYERGVSAWVKSQPVGGQEFNLFRFHTIGDGNATNSDVKVMVTNVKPSPSPLATPYGTFDVIVRKFSDTDQRVVALQTFTAVTLDPDSKNFIARVIGDSAEVFDTSQRKFIAQGNFPSRSRHIRVEMSTTGNYPAEALPWGHRGYDKALFTGGLATVPDMGLTRDQYDRNGTQDANICWGISFMSGGIEDRMKAHPNNTSLLRGADADFSLSFLTSSYFNGKQVWTYDTTVPASQQHQAVFASASLYKFNLPFAGGWDGFDIRVADPLYLSNVADDTDIGVVSAKRALDTVANPDAFDMNVLAVPGVHNLKVTDKARSVVNDRADTLFVMDITGSTVAEAINLLKNREIDDNYSACYYPDLKLNDRTNNKIVRVSPSVAILGAIAYSDRVGQVFFAPAGLTRGGLGQFDISDVCDRLTFGERNELYDNKINPIATFPNEGIVVFGQKTLQVKPSALDRINVRRLLIFAKKTIAAAAKLLLFEPNNPNTWQRFINVVNPILEKIRQDQGLNRFKVVMDTSTNTNDLIDRNIMTGKIFLEPTKSTEFIDLSFIITNAGVSFGE